MVSGQNAGQGPGALICQAFILLLLDHEEVERVMREGLERLLREVVRIYFSGLKAVTICQYRCQYINSWCAGSGAQKLNIIPSPGF